MAASLSELFLLGAGVLGPATRSERVVAVAVADLLVAMVVAVAVADVLVAMVVAVAVETVDGQLALDPAACAALVFCPGV
jgi:hypothetical protein